MQKKIWGLLAGAALLVSGCDAPEPARPTGLMKPKGDLPAAPPTLPPAPPTRTSPVPVSPAPPLAAPPSAVRAHFEQRDALDRTVWRDEVAAQAHERIFVELWDFLRSAPDPRPVLAAFPFEQIVLPDLGPPTPIGSGLIRRVARGRHALDRNDWLSWLDEQAAADTRLVATEWHHARFEPGTGGPARSQIRAELQVIRDGIRWRLKLGFDVTWTEVDAPTEDDPNGRRFAPKTIEVASVDAVGQAEPPTFTLAQRLPLGAHRPQSLLVTDLDGDGAPELLVPLADARYVFRGGRFERAPLAAQLLPKSAIAVAADFDNDGHTDLLATGQRDGRTVLALYRGAPGGAFPDAPVIVFAPGDEIQGMRVLTVGDIDRDGDLDVFAPQYRGAYNGDRMPTPFYNALDSWPAWLLRNDGGGHFADITAEAGLEPTRRRHTQSASFFDAD
ncbi:MAG: VCBS repeat-containing protein, partial [Myxococcales bacterium]|nr:VCBS repeat-containing protein [Myxococcales bacterium]